LRSIASFLREGVVFQKARPFEGARAKCVAMSIEEITAKIRAFRDARNWLQFHTPKDLAMALSIEANELMEHFLWRSTAECETRIQEKRELIADEIADVAIHLLELSDSLKLDLLAAIENKLAKNAAKYPVHKAAGSNLKYDEL
jgi:NTP pyrophosphatase (non-canonical NTP hydrolase)